jgi:Protein of unknown function (DUF3761)
MNNKFLVGLVASPVLALALTLPAYAADAADAAGPVTCKDGSTSTATGRDASAKCKDGTYSHSKHHSGPCSKHGGVAEWLTAAQ